MKTVMDAVNEFKGEWLASGGDCIFDKVSGGLSFINGNCVLFDKVCDMTQFNDLVSQLETNFGLSVTYSTYKEVHKGLMVAEESRIVELENAFNEITRETEYAACYDIACMQLDLSTVNAKPSQPVFTQAMADNGELPPIGSQYLDEDNQLCKALLHYGNFVVGDMSEHIQLRQYPTLSTARNDKVSVIDTRTNKEKACESYITKQPPLTVNEAELIKHAFYAGAKWVGE